VAGNVYHSGVVPAKVGPVYGAPRMNVLDLAVIGGGIVGLGVARLAARNGLTVAVLERSDIGSGASGTSSHMLHGGLRYLEHGHVALVHEALRERAAVSRMAPGLVTPTRFLVPSYRGDRRPRWMVAVGLALYDALAGGRSLSARGSVSARDALALEPNLAADGLTGAGLYSDVVMDDARLAVTVGMDAAAHGAAIHTWTEVTGARPGPSGGITLTANDRIEGGARTVTARVVINAAGAWSDAVRGELHRALHPGSADPDPVLRPSRGIHLVLPALTRGHAITSFAPGDGRVVFVIPFAGHSLVGTTEVEVASPPGPDAWRASVAEVRYLRTTLARLLPEGAQLPIVGVLSGVRPLLGAPGGVGAASREHRVIPDGNVITIAGGKYTTFRVMARDALAAAWPRLGRHDRPPGDRTDPLPVWPAGLDDPDALATFAATCAFARRTEDVIRRRGTLWLSPDRGRIAAPVVAGALARHFGRDASAQDEDLRHFHARLERDERVLAEAGETP
jgi:glycerol-3-phosphate dehydrogenase